MKKHLLKLLITFLILSSCTVHKRLHQPGWDINFRGNWKMNQDKQVATNFDTLSIQKIDFKVGHEQIQSALKIHSDSVNPVMNSILKENALIAINKEHSAKPTRPLRELVAKHSNKNVVKKVKQLKANTETREASVISWAFIFIGLLIFIIGLSIYFSADATVVGSFISILGIIGMAIGSIFFLIGLILLLTLLITKGVVKNEQRLKQQAKETEKTNIENKEETTETTVEEKPLPIENKSKNWLIIGGAVLVLSVLFLVIKAN